MIGVLISTTISRFLSISSHQFPYADDFYYIISCQGELSILPSDLGNHLERVFPNGNVKFSIDDGAGLSRNRNNSIRLSFQIENVDYVHICDDDVVLNLDGIRRIVNHAREEGVDIAVGKIRSESGSDFKCYPAVSRRLGCFSIARVSSIEMVLSKKLLKDGRLWFDEEFGLGSSLPSGEEFVFLADALKHGARIFFFPYFLCTHPVGTSGRDFFSTEAKVFAKGAMFGRALGFALGYLAAIVFCVKKYGEYKSERGFFSFLFLIVSGVRHGAK